MVITRRAIMVASGAFIIAPAIAQTITPTPPSERRVGIGYALWHNQSDWTNRTAGQTPWGHPELGYYVSGDRSILHQHAEWLSGANVDFALLDWSNDLGTDTRDQRGPSDQLAIENTTPLLFDVWASAPRHPKIAFLIGVPGPMLRASVKSQTEDINAVTHGDLQRKADQIYQQYVQQPRFAPMLELYLGKPLLVVMIGVPTPYRDKAPTWTDPRFTVRYMSAYLSEFRGLTADNISLRGYWSWEDRGLFNRPRW